MNFALYAAVHATPTRPTSVYAKYFLNRVEELFRVGDLQRYQQIKNDFLFDRSISNPYDLERGYIEVIVQPIMKLWCKFIPSIAEDMMEKGLKENLEFLKREERISERKLKTGGRLDESSIELKLMNDNSRTLTNN